MTADRNTSVNTGVVPRVFLSYARSDGEQFAAELRQRLEAEQIPLWQDRVGMEGGRDWWLQIKDALDVVEFLMLVMTPAAMQSKMVREEWRYARLQGVCVYPVKGKPDLEFKDMPHWMRSAHFYDTKYEWQKLVNDLNTRCQQVRVPFMCKDLPLDFVPRPNEFAALLRKLLDEKREEPLAITAALRGAGGYGKTTMALALCHNEHIQDAFDDGILWVTLGEKPSNLVGKLEDLIYILSEKRPGFTSIDTASTHFAALLADRDIVLVIDDVWNPVHLEPFLQGGKRCARLVTTRNEQVLRADVQRIPVDAMQQQEAVQLLGSGLSSTPLRAGETQALVALATRLGKWALLLKLVNGVLHERISRGQSLADACTYSNTALDRHGLTAFDDKNTQDRSHAVAKTLSVSLDLLSPDEQARYQELAVFPEDVDIPLVTVQRLWGATGRLDYFDSEEVCERLYRFSLLLDFDLTRRSIRLHNVIRTYLQQEVGALELPSMHAHFLDAYALTRWADLPADEPYLWDHLAGHLIEASRLAELVVTVKDLRYLANKTLARTTYATEADLAFAEQRAPDDVPLRLLTRNFVNMDHLLNRCSTYQEIAPVLLSRLAHLQELSDLCQAFEQDIPQPYLASWHLLPDLPDPALIRTLSGHMGYVWGCAISPAADFIVSASSDQTLKVWDARTGEERRTLFGHTSSVRGCAFSPSGDIIVSASDDRTLKVWDAITGEERRTLRGHTLGVNGCAISLEGDFIVSASSDRTLKVWDATTGEERRTLRGHTLGVNGCAISPVADFIVSASDDTTLKVWDARTGEERRTLRGHRHWVTACAISPAADFIVSASSDQTLKVWDARTGEERHTLRGHTDKVTACAISPAGDSIASASGNHTLKVWDARTGEERLTLRGHTDVVTGCVISPSGDTIVSASSDQTLKVWDARTREERHTLHGHADVVTACAISPAADFIVSASWDRTLKVWDARTGEERRTLRGHADKVTGCAISLAGDTIVSASYDRTLKVWDARTLRGHTDVVTGCAISLAGDTIVSASYDRTLKVWDARTGEERRTLRGHTNALSGCAISPAGDYIVSASWDQTLKVWDARTGEERRTLRGHMNVVYGCAISPAGDYIVSASWDQTLKVWDARTGEERLTLRGHTDRAYGCAISPRGDTIVSASSDQTLKVWDVSTGACLSTLYVNGPLNTCAFHPDGEHIVAVGAGGVYFLRWVR
jgi:WD40 repeat protein